MEGGECNGGRGGEPALSRIMLKFRPIAPKPFTGGTPSDKLPKRTKRKYVRAVHKYKEQDSRRVETLQLLPGLREETSSDNDPSKGGGSSSGDFDPRVVSDDHLHWLSLSKIGDVDYMGEVDSVSDPKKQMGGDSVADPSAVMDRMGGVESWVTVECVRGTCMIAPSSSQGFGFMFSAVSADEERMRRLEGDTCPGFISDGWNRVLWLNEAFKRMVMMTRQQRPLPEVTVWLAMNEQLPHTTCSAFTCQVKLKYTVPGTHHGEKKKKKEADKNYYSQLVPCDLWRMHGGGFAWRLDINAALTLGV
ncbi:hypothetical protein M0R45_022225 [Rubus argutus]|uniref:DUF7950 domain-containing protein n=1 Tax=Rubus argutus TaxID=59490 RepID=A0AAW1XFZ2_RUBAR